MAKLTPGQRQCLPWACQACRLLMLLGSRQFSFCEGFNAWGGLQSAEPSPDESALHK